MPLFPHAQFAFADAAAEAEGGPVSPPPPLNNFAATKFARMMRDTNGPETAVRAILALANMGKPTFLLLTRALSDTNQPERACITYAIYGNMPQAVGTNDCIPPLISALSDPDPNVRNAAKLVLIRLAPQAIPNAIPAPVPGIYYKIIDPPK